MRSSIFISLALILSLQLASSQDLIGVWTNPITTYNSDLYCCVPTSITIEAMEGTSNMKATYQFPSIFQQGYSAKCGSFFNGNVNGQAATTVYKDASSGQYFIYKYDFSGNKNYIFSVSGGSLNVQGAGTSSATTCKFTMNTKSSGSSSGFFGFILLILVVGGFVAYKKHQQKQQSAIVVQNLAQNDTTIYQPNPTYVAPQQYAYTQLHNQPQPGFVAQPQVGFVAQQPQAQVGFVAQPGQPQMTMNVNMNANPNGFMPANGAVTVNVGAPQ